MTEDETTQPPATDSIGLITRRDVLTGTMALSVAAIAHPRFARAGAEVGGLRPAPSKEVLEQEFRHPPLEYAPVDNWWWEAGHLNKEKITWQLQEFKDKGIGGTWFYVRWTHGESLTSNPHYWTPEWWEFTRYSVAEHKRLGLTHWFSNWTNLQFQQDQVRQERANRPALWGRNLVMYSQESDGNIELGPEDELLEAVAYQKRGGAIDYSTRRLLTATVRDRKLKWQAPGPGWVVTVLVTQPWDLNYLDKAVGQRFTAAGLAEYEMHLPEYVGNTLQAFGADEMFVLSPEDSPAVTLYSTALLERVRATRGYDLAPYLVALFHDIGAKTEQIRCDYYGTMSVLLEENFYLPPTQWLESRGMRHATISQLGEEPLSQTLQYGDFLRYLRTFHVPGNEDPFRSKPGERRLFGSKISSSIAHLYERERVVLCVHYGTGWGQTQEENLAWTNEAYAKGLNLYCRHGAYYSLLGGWYEWVPPMDHFFQPHWRYWGAFTQYITRLSYILSQGKHRADVALFYPLTTIHAHWTAGGNPNDWDGENLEAAGVRGPFGPAAVEASKAVQDLTKVIYHDGIDLDVVDNDSLERAVVKGDLLEISGVEFRSIVLPPLSTVRLASVRKMREFYEAGGIIVAYGRLPTASAENGREDPELRTLVEGIFGPTPQDRPSIVHHANARGGKAYFVTRDIERIPSILSEAIVRAVSAPEKDLFLLHKKIGGVDVFFLFNVRQEARELPVRFRAQGRVEIWDAFTGDARPAYHWQRLGDSLTEVRLKMGPTEGVLVVFSPGEVAHAVIEDNLFQLVKIEGDETLIVHGFDDSGGNKRVRVRRGEREYVAETRVAVPPGKISLQGPFEFRLEPTMNNRWGDFRYPPTDTFIGAEARRFRYAEEDVVVGIERNWHRADFDDAQWPETIYTYGPYWWHLGGFMPGQEPEDFLDQAPQGEIDVQRSWGNGATELHWRPYAFSQKFGSTSVLMSGFLKLFGGLLGVPENFLVLDQAPPGNDTHYFFTHVRAPRQGDYFLCAGVKPDRLFASQPLFDSRAPSTSVERVLVPSRTRAWINGKEVLLDIRPEKADGRARVALREGWNTVLLQVVRPDAGPIALYAALFEFEPPPDEPNVPLLRWFREPQQLLYDITPNKAPRVGWYRFKAPPGMRAMSLQTSGRVLQAWVDGEPVSIDGGRITRRAARTRVSQVALRVEQQPGIYAGAVFPQPIAFECATGEIPLGDWSDQGLATYSGVGVYGRIVHLQKRQVESRVILDLGRAGNVAEAFVNGKSAGVKLARPFQFDVSELVKEGPNRLEIKVANTLANHMSTYPTQWVLEGQTVSGLLGPVELRFQTPVKMLAR